MIDDIKGLVDELVDEIDGDTAERLNGNDHFQDLCLYGSRESRYLKGIAAKARQFDIAVRWFDCPPPTHPDGPYIVDVESFGNSNLYRIPAVRSYDLDCTSGDYLSCTAEACLELLNRLADVTGKHVCIIGRGHAVQRLRDNLLYANATVTVCHSKTANMREVAATAEIVVNSAPRLHAYCDVGFKLRRIILDISGALKEWEDCELLTYVGPREIGRLNTALTLNRLAHI